MRAHQLALMVVGIVCLLAALIHAMWMWFMPGYALLASLSPVQLDTIVLLNAAITLFLFVMAVATLLVSKAKTLSLRHVQVFSLLLMSFWAGRFLLELIMPLRIPLLTIENPGVFAKVFMALPVLILAIPFVLKFRNRSVHSG